MASSFSMPACASLLLSLRIARKGIAGGPGYDPSPRDGLTGPRHRPTNQRIRWDLPAPFFSRWESTLPAERQLPFGARYVSDGRHAAVGPIASAWLHIQQKSFTTHSQHYVKLMLHRLDGAKRYRIVIDIHGFEGFYFIWITCTNLQYMFFEQKVRL